MYFLFNLVVLLKQIIGLTVAVERDRINLIHSNQLFIRNPKGQNNVVIVICFARREKKIW